MAENVDLAAYFDRVGYRGSRTPTLAALREIVAAHTERIPFENIDPLSGRAVALNPEALEDKLVRQRRGGYCFEHNLLLANVLQQLGFEVVGLTARVLWNSRTPTSPRSHMLLTVELDSHTHIVDVGFGGLTLTGVLRFEPRVEQPTPHEPFRLLEAGNEHVLEALVRGEWRPLYSFDRQPQRAVDYEPVNWYLSTHPQSRFLQNLLAARAEPGRRFALFNAELAVHETCGTTHRTTLTSAEQLRAALERDFLLDVPDTPQVQQAFERIIAESPAHGR